MIVQQPELYCLDLIRVVTSCNLDEPSLQPHLSESCDWNDQITHTDGKPCVSPPHKFYKFTRRPSVSQYQLSPSVASALGEVGQAAWQQWCTPKQQLRTIGDEAVQDYGRGLRSRDSLLDL